MVYMENRWGRVYMRLEETFTDVILASLATHRFTLLLSQEDGPGDVLATFRRKIGIEKILQGDELIVTSDTIPGNLFLCPYCLSGWVALVLVSILALFPWLARIIVLWGAVWWVTNLLFDMLGEDE